MLMNFNLYSWSCYRDAILSRIKRREKLIWVVSLERRVIVRRNKFNVRHFLANTLWWKFFHTILKIREIYVNNSIIRYCHIFYNILNVNDLSFFVFCIWEMQIFIETNFLILNFLILPLISVINFWQLI